MILKILRLFWKVLRKRFVSMNLILLVCVNSWFVFVKIRKKMFLICVFRVSMVVVFSSLRSGLRNLKKILFFCVSGCRS